MRLEIRSARRLGTDIARDSRTGTFELVHALRLPFESFALQSLERLKLKKVASVWGQDFVRQASGNSLISSGLGSVVPNLDGIHADCSRDIFLAREYGLRNETKTLVAPGNFGIDDSTFNTSLNRDDSILAQYKIPHNKLLIVCPRRPTDNIHWKDLLLAFSELVDSTKNIHLVMVAAAGYASVEKCISDLDISSHTTLTRELNKVEMSQLFKASAITISPSDSDGLPNSVLEAMACGSTVVLGQLNSTSDYLLDRVNCLVLPSLESHHIKHHLNQLLNDQVLRYELSTRGSNDMKALTVSKSMVSVFQFYVKVLSGN